MRMLGIAFILSFMSSIAVAQEIDLSLKGKKVIHHVDIELSKTQQIMLAKFARRRDFYAAITVDQSPRSARSMSFFSNINSLNVAQDMAMRLCRVITNQPDQCILLASIVPENMPATSTSPTLSVEKLGALKEFLEWPTDPNRYSAFAANDVWVHGWAFERFTQKQAETDALQFCEKRAANVVYRQVPRKWRKSVIGDSDRCKIIYVAKPN